ncbi:MAG: protein ligase [Pseudomonadota bacterium]
MPDTTIRPLMARLDTGAALEREGTLLVEASLQPSLRYLWFWEGSQALVVPRKLAVKPGFERACEMMRAGGWPVHVRATGGDVTPQGPGIFNMTHVYTRPAGAKMSLAGEYDLICGPIERALGPGATRGWQPGAFCDGAYNVQLMDKKFAGTAMRLKPSRAEAGRAAVLAHAIMLAHPPRAGVIAALNRFLEAMEEPREIRLDAHTGLPAALGLDGFLERLSAELDGLETLSEELILL